MLSVLAIKFLVAFFFVDLALLYMKVLVLLNLVHKTRQQVRSKI